MRIFHSSHEIGFLNFMNKITGIKSVDFRVVAEGYGVVNWNGPTAVAGKDGKDLNNHSIPKLRGYSNLTGKKSEKGFSYKKSPYDVDFNENPLYVSQNCIRHFLFKEYANDAHYLKKDKQIEIISSSLGLLRGYVIPSTGAKRTSPLFLTDFVDQLGNGNYEQMARYGSKSDESSANSIFSKITFGDTKYEAYGSINIEELSFISLDDKHDRAALIGLKKGEVDLVIANISNYIKNLNPNKTFAEPLVAYHKNYVRQGTLFLEGEEGLLLSDEAIDTLIDHMINRIKNLSIKQGKGYLVVTNVEVDYNDSQQMMRIKHKPDSVVSTKEKNYATYFVGA